MGGPALLPAARWHQNGHHAGGEPAPAAHPKQRWSAAKQLEREAPSSQDSADVSADASLSAHCRKRTPERNTELGACGSPRLGLMQTR
jgi:hypothetical protein